MMSQYFSVAPSVTDNIDGSELEQSNKKTGGQQFFSVKETIGKSNYYGLVIYHHEMIDF